MSVQQPAPGVAIVIPNANGAAHLATCLDSVAALEYPRERLETTVVDNRSTDGSLQLLRKRYPWVRVLPQAENLGFAEAVNVAADATAAECLALMNNDMRLQPGWLRELVGAYDPGGGYPCVGGVILDWEGKRVDFVGGFVTFYGAAGQNSFGEPLARVRVEDGRELPFACGGSMLIRRELFLELGGFDPSFFAYFEDVDLGWRLRLAGHNVRLAARARTFHRHHGSASTFSADERQKLYERNALRMLLKNLDEENLARVLAAALLLAGGRATPASRLAVAEVLADLDDTLDRRAAVQARRRRSDAEVFASFGRPFAPLWAPDAAAIEAMARLVRAFRLDELFDEPWAWRPQDGPPPEDPDARTLVEAWRRQAGLGPGGAARAIQRLRARK